MSEVNQPQTSPSAAPASVAPAQPSGVPPAGPPTAPPVAETVTVSKADLDRYTRYEQQVKGFSPFQQRLAQIGVRSPEELDQVLNPVLTARDAGLDLAAMIGAVRKPEQPTQPQPASNGQFNPSETMRYVDTRIAADRHEQASREQDRHAQLLVSELAGPNATPEQKWLAEAAVERALYTSMQPYPKGHPLHGHGQYGFAPVTDFTTIAETAKKNWASVGGNTLAALATATPNAPRVAPTGQPGQGPGSQPAQNNAGTLREAALAQAGRFVAAQMGSPASAY